LDSIRFIVIMAGAAPFLFFLDRSWAALALLIYLLTGGLFGMLLMPDYPRVGTITFWKSIVPIALLHLIVIGGIVYLYTMIPYVNKLPRMMYGFALLVVLLEWRISQRIIDTFTRSR
jgi:hypothetical protein